jgi:hypothetical protein
VRKIFGTAARVRRYAFGVAVGELFTSRDLLNLGPRDAVDKAISRMVRAGEVRRVARGVFVRLDWDSPLPGIIEIATAKAKAFGRRILTHASKALQRLLKEQGGDDATQIFATDGATTSFVVGDERVVLKRYAPRKLMLEDKIQGLVVRALWDAGRHAVRTGMLRDITWSMNRTDSAELKLCCNVMPSWLSEKVAWSNSSSHRKW